MEGKRISFTIPGFDGKPHSGRGVVEERRASCVIVRLTSNDLGGFGTYMRGDRVWISEREISK